MTISKMKTNNYTMLALSMESLTLSTWELVSLLMKKHKEMSKTKRSASLVYRVQEFNSGHDDEGRTLPNRRMDIGGVYLDTLNAIPTTTESFGHHARLERAWTSLAEKFAEIGVPHIKRLVKPKEKKTRTWDQIGQAKMHIARLMIREERRIARIIGRVQETLNPVIRETMFALNRLEAAEKPNKVQEYDLVFEWVQRIRCERRKQEAFHETRAMGAFCFNEGLIAEELVYRWFLGLNPYVNSIPSQLLLSMPIMPFFTEEELHEFAIY